MKRALMMLAPLAMLALSAGCDETELGVLPSGVQTAVLSVAGKADALAKPIQDRLRLHSMDGSGDGQQHQYGGAGPTGGGGGGNGDGDRDRDRKRDGSCNDGG